MGRAPSKLMAGKSVAEIEARSAQAASGLKEEGVGVVREASEGCFCELGGRERVVSISDWQALKLITKSRVCAQVHAFVGKLFIFIFSLMSVEEVVMIKS